MLFLVFLNGHHNRHSRHAEQHGIIRPLTGAVYSSVHVNGLAYVWFNGRSDLLVGGDA